MLCGNKMITDAIYMAINGSDDMPNMANNLEGVITQTAAKNSLGRESAVEDGQLWTRRYELVFLFEGTWPDIGGKVSKIKTATDVYDMVKVWQEQDRQTHSYVAKVLLRSSAAPAHRHTLCFQPEVLKIP